MVGSDTFTMPAGVDGGLAVSSHIAGTLAAATFDNVAVTWTSPPAGQGAFISAAPQVFAPAPPPPDWWRLYQDPVLDGLVQQALTENADLFRRLLWETPFDPTARNWKTFKQAAGFLNRNWRIGGKLFRVLDMLSMSAYDFLTEWFEDDRIKAVLAYYASIGTFAGPRSPGSAYVIMHHVMGENAGAG